LILLLLLLLLLLTTHRLQKPCCTTSLCIDPAAGAAAAAQNTPPAETVLHYEFMQDYKVHLKHTDGHYEKVPYFCLPAKDLNDVIAPSCYSCFDYPNALADLVVSGVGMYQKPCARSVGL
jgi:hypothetical protein